MTEQFNLDWLEEICGNCGHTYGSHHAGSSPWPFSYCPDPDCRMNWEKGPGTIFKPTGIYREE
jgi:hypothetical protein